MASPVGGYDYATQANILNDLFEQLGSEYDALYETMTPSGRLAIQQALSNWQDWYYGNFEDWGDSDEWQNAYNAARILIDAERQAGAVVAAPIISEPAPAPILLPPIYITGQVPREPEIYDPDAEALDYNLPDYQYQVYKEPSTPWGLIIGGGLAAVLLYKASKKR